MRNLAGRLTARSNAELMRIAEFWQTIVRGRDRHAVVGQLYREMREVRSARDVWARLDANERAIVSLMALDDQDERSWTLRELSDSLGWELEETRERAIDLYRKGLVYREGDDDELPVGELPRVFLPRELTSSFRRVQDEIDAGPLERVPLPALLALLDETELEQAATIWGVEVYPGLQDRENIARQLTQAMEDPDQRTAVIAGLSNDARAVWTLLVQREDGAAPLAELLEAAGIDGSEIAAAQRGRNALGELEECLLAWHSYGHEESRQVFVPNSIRERRRHIEREARVPQPVQAPATADLWIHPWALPWDMLTLLREVSKRPPPAPLTSPHLWKQRIGGRLWNSGSEDHISGYLAFLAALGRNENVFQDGVGDENGILQPGRAWKQWRTRSFADQYSHLIWWWLASPEWIESTDQSGVIVNRAALPQFRRKLIALMSQLDVGVWFDFEDAARWVADIDPDILGEEAAIATSAALAAPLGHPDRSRLATAAVVQAELATAFAWFGLTEMGRLAGGEVVMRTTDVLQGVQAGGPLQEEAPPAGPAIIVQSTGEIELRAPSPLRVWALSAFADPVSLRPVASYTITETSLRRALEDGPTLDDVTRFLEEESGTSPSAELAEHMQSWAAADRQVTIRLTAELIPNAEVDRAGLRSVVSEAGLELAGDEERVQILLPDDHEHPGQLHALMDLLTQAGYRTRMHRPPGLRSRENDPGGQ